MPYDWNMDYIPSKADKPTDIWARKKSAVRDSLSTTLSDIKTI